MVKLLTKIGKKGRRVSFGWEKISLIIDRLNLLQGSARGNVLKAPENNGSGSGWKPKFSGLDLELIGM